MRRTGLALALTAALAPAHLAAQPTDQGKRAGPPTPTAAPPPPPQPQAPDPNAPPPYEPQVMRLAELLGALHHLRTVCKDADANQWRDRMAALIEAEAPAPERRDRLAGAFNASFRTWARSYRACTPAAIAATRMFMSELSKIATDVRARYGP